MSFAPETSPVTEAVIRSPLGEIRVWLDLSDNADTAHAVRTSIRVDFCDDAERIRHDQDALRLVAELSRAVRGLSGIGPAEVSANSAPSVGPWLVERTESDPSTRTLSLYLYQDYLAWCDRRGFSPVARVDFGRDLDSRGFRTAGNIRQGGVQGRAKGGLRLRPEAVPMTGARA